MDAASEPTPHRALIQNSETGATLGVHEDQISDGEEQKADTLKRLASSEPPVVSIGVTSTSEISLRKFLLCIK